MIYPGLLKSQKSLGKAESGLEIVRPFPEALSAVLHLRSKRCNCTQLLRHHLYLCMSVNPESILNLFYIVTLIRLIEFLAKNECL